MTAKISDVEFTNRELNPRWNTRADMAKKIRDFLDVQTRGPRFVKVDPVLARYRNQIQSLRAHLNSRLLCDMIQAGLLP